MFSIHKKQVIVKQKNVYVEVEQRKRFKNCVCLITGASGSIGMAIARRFAVEGAILVLTGRNESKLLEAKDALRDVSDMVDIQVMDVTDVESIEIAMKIVNEKYGQIDILINNAGYSARTVKQPLHLQTIENIDNLLETNLRGSVMTSRCVIKYMKESEQGRIVHIASIVGIQGKSKHAEYAATKAGLFGLMKSQAIEVGKYGITVNCVSSGLVPREDADNEKVGRFAEMNRLGTICTPDDIANTVLFLCSQEARFITGQNISVDGGRSLGLYGD